MNPPAGWNTDPAEPGIERYWDGQQWTGQTRPTGVGSPRRKWPWVAGIAGVVVAGFVAIGVVAGPEEPEGSTTPVVVSSTKAAATTTPVTTTKITTTKATTTATVPPTTTTTVPPTTTTTVAPMPFVPPVRTTTTTSYVPPAPAYVPPPKTETAYVPPPVDVPGTAVYYANCAAVRAAGAAPILIGEPGYSRKLDRDGDGVGCEW